LLTDLYMAFAHPTSDMLTAYATGSATEGVSLLVATHLTYCAGCRARIAEREAMSGALFVQGDAAEMGADALKTVLARLEDGSEPPRRDAANAPAAAPVMDATRLPHTITASLGDRELRWRFRMPGVSEIELPGSDGERISLIKVRPGASVPAHTHTAEEATLVLCGSLHDRDMVYKAGDVAIADVEDDHHPKAGPEGDCICLTVMAGGVRFTGAFGRALNIFAE
jgi:putative transcriptional regulator